MQRREFLSTVLGAAVLHASAFAGAAPSAMNGAMQSLSGIGFERGASAGAQKAVQPMAIGALVHPSYDNPEDAIARVGNLGMSNCFLDLDDYIGRFSSARAQQFRSLLDKYGVTATAVEVVGPGRLVWDFVDGPSTIGLVPPATRTARIDALKQASNFAKQIGVAQVQTHCGFIPENPKNPLYDPAVLAIREVAVHCAGNGQDFLMETGQETPTTMWRAIVDVDRPNLGVGLDTANLILYGKANPVEAVGQIGRYVRSVHAKDGMWPTNPMELGKEVLIGTGCVDFPRVFLELDKLGYKGAITIERETTGPQQWADIKEEKATLERVLARLRTHSA